MGDTTSEPQAGDPPPLRAQLWTWLAVGAQSFGGGAATLALIRRGFVEDRRWISDEEFTRYWAICQLAPGINLVSFAILIGRRLGGAGGVFAALAGMLLPSAAITVAMTAGYAGIRDSDQVKAALRAVIPVTVGLGLATAIKMAIPLIAAGRARGTGTAIVAIGTLCLSGVAIGLLQIPIVAVLFGSGLVGAAAYQFLGADDESKAAA
jgi:chromate transporter